MLPAPVVTRIAAAAVLAGTLVPLRRDSIGVKEQKAFRLVNNLPDRLYVPAWPVMQLGNFAAAPATAAVALVAGNRPLAIRLLSGGTAAWALAKAIKGVVRRGRPVTLLTGVRTRGQEATGLGYLSGHTAVSVALAAAAWPHLGAGGRQAALAVPSIVGMSRVYVGAHLPLDVAAGAALGLLIDSAWSFRRTAR